MTANHDDLGAARQLLEEQAKRYGVRRVRDKYFKEGPSVGTLKSVIKDGLRGKSSDTKTAVLNFYRKVLAEKDEEAKTRLYHVLRTVLFNADDQSGAMGAQNYVGSYVCYRIQTGTENSDSPNLLIGKIVIEHVAADGSYRFTHTSADSSLEVENTQVEHSGPFFVLVNRVYLVGLGQDIYGPYMRPIIFQASGSPQTVPLKGVVLTESATDNVPVAARTVLFHDDLHRGMKAKYGGREAMNRFVLNYLRADARNPTLQNGAPVNATNLLGW